MDMISLIVSIISLGIGGYLFYCQRKSSADFTKLKTENEKLTTSIRNYETLIGEVVETKLKGQKEYIETALKVISLRIEKQNTDDKK